MNAASIQNQYTHQSIINRNSIISKPLQTASFQNYFKQHQPITHTQSTRPPMVGHSKMKTFILPNIPPAHTTLSFCAEPKAKSQNPQNITAFRRSGRWGSNIKWEISSPRMVGAKRLPISSSSKSVDWINPWIHFLYWRSKAWGMFQFMREVER